MLGSAMGSCMGLALKGRRGLVHSHVFVCPSVGHLTREWSIKKTIQVRDDHSIGQLLLLFAVQLLYNSTPKHPFPIHSDSSNTSILWCTHKY